MQKQYSVLLGGVTDMDECTWTNDAQRVEAGHPAGCLVRNKSFNKYCFFFLTPLA
jgi:hypothetical protein